ncbi:MULTISPECIES: hypothetical protein [Vibrio]|uniref:hypothetical protein n=1 Tax=Vibrio TaxID=662 RepID=UPI000B5402E0|nr:MULTISPECIES: hypothetical protein [Vibrio]ASG06514.1 hypothetical protein CEQ50_02670 [Vibrio anguillarum]MCX8951627.1 hypothetical protein [Vibrio parahaemolyticus]
MKALLSIKPKYVDEIISGKKKYEFRKKTFKRDIDSIIVYCTSPIKMVVGEIFFSETISDTPRKIWKQCSDSSGISKDDFFSYYEGCPIAYAIKIERFKLYDKPLLLSDIKKDLKAPQSFIYIGIGEK